MERNSNRNAFFTSAWFIEDGSFRDWRKNQTPLLSLGISSANRMGIKIILPVLEGYSSLPAKNLQELEKVFDVIDYTDKFKKIILQFPNIDRFYTGYERNCFLRWLAFKELLRADTEQFWHFDSDVVLHTALDEIVQDTRGKTFILQGGSAFATISDMSWFDTYERELKKLEENIAEYSAKAAEEKAECQNNDRRLGNVSLYRNPIGSDQDLIEYLVSSGKLPQDDAHKTTSDRFFYIENPLLIGWWAEKSFPAVKKDIELKDDGLYCCNRKIPFIHYQGTFCFYANLYIALSKFHLDGLFDALKMMGFKISGAKFIISPQARLFWKLARRIGLEYPREKIIGELEADNQHKLVTLLELIIKNNNIVALK